MCPSLLALPLPTRILYIRLNFYEMVERTTQQIAIEDTLMTFVRSTTPYVCLGLGQYMVTPPPLNTHTHETHLKLKSCYTSFAHKLLFSRQIVLEEPVFERFEYKWVSGRYPIFQQLKGFDEVSGTTLPFYSFQDFRYLSAIWWAGVHCMEQLTGSPLMTAIIYTSLGFRTCIDYYIHVKQSDIITHPYGTCC